MNLAFVLPRYDQDGDGSGRVRDLGLHLVARGHSLEVLSTPARSGLAWEDAVERVTPETEGLTVRRFPVTQTPDGEAPVVPGLVQHLRRHRRGFDVAVFFSCPTWAEANGLAIAPESSILVTAGCRHRATLREIGATVVSETAEEQAGVAAAASGARAEVIGPGLDLGREPKDRETPAALQGLGQYLVLLAPLEAKDGCAVTIDSFLQAEREGRAPLTLVLIGKGRISLGENVHVRQLGDLSAAARDEATRGALAVLVPSRLEGLAPSALRAWRLGRPVIAHGPSQVMRGIVERANGGVACATVEELAAALELLSAEPSLGDTLGRQGRDYLAEHHAWPVVLQKWESLLRRVAPGGARAA